MVKIYIKECQLHLEKSSHSPNLESESVCYSSMHKEYSSRSLKKRRKTLPLISSRTQKVLCRSWTWSEDKRLSELANTGSTPSKYSKNKKCTGTSQTEAHHSVLEKRTCSVGNLFCCIFGIIFGTLLIFNLLSLLAINKSDCNLKSYLHQLDTAISTKVYGQHIASNIVLEAISKYFNKPYHLKPLVLSFHGWSGCGKTWMSRIITSLIRPNNVHIFPLPSKFDDILDLVTDNFVFGLFADELSHCPHVIVLDDMNKVSPDFVNSLTELLNFWNITSNTWNKTIILLLSSTGDAEINKYAFQHRLDDRFRGILNAEEFLPILNNSKDVWYKPLLENQLIDAFVPFLPLEREHVRLCIEYQLKKKKADITDEIIEAVLGQINFFPENNPIFSKSGCKKIATKVHLITG